MKAVVYMRIRGFGDEPLYGQMDLGESKELTKEKYDKAIEELKANKMPLVKAMCMEDLITQDDIDIITEEEYLNETEED